MNFPEIRSTVADWLSGGQLGGELVFVRVTVECCLITKDYIDPVSRR